MSAPTLNHRATGYDARQAYCMAKVAEPAYRDRERIEATAAEWGFDRVRHHRSTFSPPFAISDTQAYTMASPAMIVTAFRGTEPAQLRDWLSDTTTPPWPGPAGTGAVHYGFAEALRAVMPDDDHRLRPPPPRRAGRRPAGRPHPIRCGGPGPGAGHGAAAAAAGRHDGGSGERERGRRADRAADASHRGLDHL